MPLWALRMDKEAPMLWLSAIIDPMWRTRCVACLLLVILPPSLGDCESTNMDENSDRKTFAQRIDHLQHRNTLDHRYENDFDAFDGDLDAELDVDESRDMQWPETLPFLPKGHGIVQYRLATQEPVRTLEGFAPNEIESQENPMSRSPHDIGTRTIPFMRLPTHSVMHTQGDLGPVGPNHECIPPPVSESMYPEFSKAVPYAKCFEVEAGDTLYIPGEYWHWVWSEGFSLAMNLWTTFPHRDYTRPKLFKHEAKHWPAMTKLNANEFRRLWELDFAGSGTGMGIWCSGHKAIYPEMVMRSFEGDKSDNLTELSAAEFVSIANDFTNGADSLGERGCIAMETLFPESSFSQEQLFRFKLRSNTSFGHYHGPEHLFETPPESGVVNIWSSLGQVQSGLHYDQEYNSLTVIRGRKRVILFPRNVSHFLYPAVPWNKEDLESRKRFIGPFQKDTVLQDSLQALSYVKGRDPNDAILLVTDALEQFPDNPWIMLKSAQLLVKHRVTDFAEDLFEAILQSSHIGVDEDPYLQDQAAIGLMVLRSDKK